MSQAGFSDAHPLNLSVVSLIVAFRPPRFLPEWRSSLDLGFSVHQGSDDRLQVFWSSGPELNWSDVDPIQGTWPGRGSLLGWLNSNPFQSRAEEKGYFSAHGAGCKDWSCGMVLPDWSWKAESHPKRSLNRGLDVEGLFEVIIYCWSWIQGHPIQVLSKLKMLCRWVVV